MRNVKPPYWIVRVRKAAQASEGYLNREGSYTAHDDDAVLFRTEDDACDAIDDAHDSRLGWTMRAALLSEELEREAREMEAESWAA